MIYILIVMLSGVHGRAGFSVEFSDFKSCQVAATEIQRQDTRRDVSVIMCAGKRAAP